MIRHIFSAEKRYIERLTGRPLTDTTAVPADRIESLFEFSQSSRRGLMEFIESCPSAKWDTAEEHKIIDRPMLLTTKKIVMHVVLHEIRHGAKIATMLRQQGRKGEFHDFLFSPVLAAPDRETAAGV